MPLTIKKRLQFVEDARKALPALKNEMQEALETYQRLREQVLATQRLLGAWDSFDPNATENNEPAQGQLLADTPLPLKEAAARAPKGQVYKHVDEVMKDGNLYKLLSLRTELMKRFDHKYGITSLHRALVRGTKEKKYKFENGQWSLK